MDADSLDVLGMDPDSPKMMDFIPGNHLGGGAPALKNMEFSVLFSLIFPTFWVSPSQMNEVFHSNIQEGIRHYYDDLDFKNILDFVQEKVWMGKGGVFQGMVNPCPIFPEFFGVILIPGVFSLDSFTWLGLPRIFCPVLPP